MIHPSHSASNNKITRKLLQNINSDATFDGEICHIPTTTNNTKEAEIIIVGTAIVDKESADDMTIALKGTSIGILGVIRNRGPFFELAFLYRLALCIHPLICRLVVGIAGIQINVLHQFSPDIYVSLWLIIVRFVDFFCKSKQILCVFDLVGVIFRPIALHLSILRQRWLGADEGAEEQGENDEQAEAVVFNVLHIRVTSSQS